jgi:hypothetical protein
VKQRRGGDVLKREFPNDSPFYEEDDFGVDAISGLDFSEVLG